MGKMEARERQVLKGRRVAVAGAGRSGRAAAMMTRALGAEVRLLEKNAASLDQEFLDQAANQGIACVTGEHDPVHFQDVDMVVMSPGIPVSMIRPLLPGARVEVLGELELASRYVCKPILAITGTSGKTTTTALAARMLEYVGHRVFCGGNIGAPLAGYVLDDSEVDILVLEVSSFQLQTCSTFKPWVGVLLNLSPNHLDYHKDMDEYAAAKLSLFSRQDEGDHAILPLSQRAALEPVLNTRARVLWYTPKSRFYCKNLPGAHNQSNMEAAYQATRIFGVTENEAQRAVEGFAPPPHRLATVAEHQGVLYVNDSKATTVEALRVALQSFRGPIFLLAGGKFKGGDLASLTPLLRERVQAVALYGGSRDVFSAAWNGATEVHWEEDMTRAFAWVQGKLAGQGVVLLSPATASFDQFKDYEERGRHFEQLVRQLTGGEA